MRLQRDVRHFGGAAAPLDERGAYRPVSYWQETVAITPGDPLKGDTTCDVAILGGGFTGLSCARELKRAKPDLDVVLLEQAVVGHGASGRNGGFAMPLLGWDLTDLVHKRGEAEARSAYRLMYAAVDHVKRLADEEQIACDLESTGYLLIATCAKRDAAVRREAELGQKLGFDHCWLSPDEVRAHIRSESFRSGVYDPHPCVLNPAKLARGMKAAIERLGARVYEQTPLVELTDDDPVRIRTPGGTVRARTAILALNGYGGALGFLRPRVLPVHTYIVLTEPLSDAQLDSIGWRAQRTSLETARNFIHYFRLTADNRIAFGGEDAELYWGGGYRDRDDALCAALERRFREFFPGLAAARFTHRWGGVLGVTIDMFPTFGESTASGRVFHACGYSGHGVALSNYAGCILAPRVLQRLGVSAASGRAAHDAGPAPFFYNRLPPWLPPDPWRYWGMKAYRRALQTLDWWEGS